ncbi:MAG: glycosyltransferase family 2 protein [Bacilli bacterium]|nr:glycosyltransferase family 2 protein [Bacilli bacterium]
MDFWIIVRDWIYSYLGINIIMDAVAENRPIPIQGYIQTIFSSLTLILGLLVCYRVLYFALGMFGSSRKYPVTEKKNRYAFIIPAWNEEEVIGNLIDSIRALDYPQDLIEIFVNCDNCTDKTGAIAEEKGAHVYYHDNPNERTKGYGLKFLFAEMAKTYDIANDFYAYTVFDADNVPAPDFLAKINDCLVASGADECIGYRNCKNVDENWVSAICAVQSYSRNVNSLRARSILNTNQEIYGCSTTLRAHVLANGWPWVTLTEDLEMMSDLTAQNYKTAFCEEAVFYEEQPTTLKLLWRQRLRWGKGGLIAFAKCHWALFASFCKKPTWSKYDIYWHYFPFAFVAFWWTLLYQIISIVLFLIVGDAGYNWWSFASYLLTTFGGLYVSWFFMDLVVIIREWKHILLPWQRLPLYIFLFPLYSLVDPIIAACSAFVPTKWGKIDHHVVKEAKALKEAEDLKSQAAAPKEKA